MKPMSEKEVMEIIDEKFVSVKRHLLKKDIASALWHVVDGFEKIYEAYKKEKVDG